MSIRARKEIPKIQNRDGTGCYLCGLELVDLRLPPWDDYPNVKTPKPRHRPDNWPTLDHVVPVCQGGTDGMYNLKAACAKCNIAKADLSVEEFFEAIGLALEIRENFRRKVGGPMQKVNDKLYNWASQLDINAQLQAERTARLPIVERVALMPDAHLGMGATVGSVIATNGAVIPAAVGVDIGCGMAAVEFDLTADDLPDDLERFMPLVERAIPAGVGQGHDGGTNAGYQWLKHNIDKFTTDIQKEKLDKLAIEQLGSLGSGNHFFEVCLDERDHVWIVLHSGSRGIGNKLATRHIKQARDVCGGNRIHLEDKDLAYLTEDDPEFQMYIGDMLACQDWAMANRQIMLERALAAFRKFMDRSTPIVQTINCHHNFTQKEIHNGREVWITRKGAIKADVGDKGVIPGSMGTRTHIVSGLGNEDSFCSCSHGAGRIHSRSAAKKLFTTDDLEAAMEGKVWNSGSAQALVDEIPGAYKPIEVVMEDQKDLVKSDHVLHQVLNFKGQ